MSRIGHKGDKASGIEDNAGAVKRDACKVPTNVRGRMARFFFLIYFSFELIDKMDKMEFLGFL